MSFLAIRSFFPSIPITSTTHLQLSIMPFLRFIARSLTYGIIKLEIEVFTPSRFSFS
jgi:hypothetical protein